MAKVNLSKKVLKNLDSLKEREQEILDLRFGLSGNSPKTLQAIGKKHSITRERVRQVVNHCFKKLKKAQNKTLEEISKKIEITIKAEGNLIPEQNLASKIAPQDKALKTLGAIEVVCRINPKLTKIKKTPKTQVFWATKDMKLVNVLKINKSITQALKKIKKIQTAEELAKKLNQKAKKLTSETIQSTALGSHNIIITPKNKIGLASWPEINPRNTKDKIFYVLNRAKKPLHFSEIARQIDEKKFATRNPTQTTVHNELISDKRFVLIGRGIYALKKWGYESGTVLDLLKRELRKHQKGLSRDAICQKILKKRVIAKNTILMNLNSNKNFIKDKKDNWKLKTK